MANLSAIKLPNGTVYNLKDNGALQLTGGSVTGPVSFGDSVSIDEATVGDLVVNGSASFTNGAHGVIDKAKAADVTSTLNALVKYEDTEGTFSDSNIYNTSNNLIIGSTSVPGNIQIGAKNDNYGILPNTNNYNQIGSSSLYWYRAYINNYYGLNSHVTNWDAGKNIGTASTSSAAATLGSVYFYNACAAGGTQTKTLLSNGSATSNITVTLPSATGTLALTNQIPNISGKADKATTLAGYGITNAYTKTEVDNLFNELPEPMIFKGSVGTGGTITSLPTATTDNEGWTYKVITALSSPSAKVGDTVISNGSSWIVIPSGDEPSGTVTSVAVSNGGGLSVSGSPITSSGTITISHADTSSQASSSNSGRTYIQSLTLDSYGHVTKISTATETVTNTDKKLQIAAVTSGNTYYPIVGTGTVAATREYDTTGFKYEAQTGTTSAVGNATLTLGNSKGVGVDTNKQGKIKIFGRTVHSHTIQGGEPTEDRILTLPNATGTIALTSQIPTVPTTTESATTGITASTTATKTTLGTAFTIPNVTSAGSASTWAFEEISIPNVTSAGSASTWAFEEKTIPNVTSAGSASTWTFEDVACDDITSWSAGSGSASIIGKVDSNDSTQLNITIDHTHTAPTLQYTARTVSSKKSGANSTAPTLGTAIKVQSKKSGANGTAPTLGTAIKVQSKKSGANGSAPTLGTAFTVPNVTGNTSATVSITDPGHTHSI